MRGWASEAGDGLATAETEEVQTARHHTRSIPMEAPRKTTAGSAVLVGVTEVLERNEGGHIERRSWAQAVVPSGRRGDLWFHDGRRGNGG